jgi:DNA-binding transcriptional MerR regulator
MSAKSGVQAPGMHHIGQVAEVVGVSLRAIRHYEDVGLAPPSGRSLGGFRLYTDEDIERLCLVKQIKPLDFSLEEIRAALDARSQLRRGVTGPRRLAALESLRSFATRAEDRCRRRDQELSAARELTAALRRELGPAHPEAGRSHL